MDEDVVGDGIGGPRFFHRSLSFNTERTGGVVPDGNADEEGFNGCRGCDGVAERLAGACDLLMVDTVGRGSNVTVRDGLAGREGEVGEDGMSGVDSARTGSAISYVLVPSIDRRGLKHQHYIGEFPNQDAGAVWPPLTPI